MAGAGPLPAPGSPPPHRTNGKIPMWKASTGQRCPRVSAAVHRKTWTPKRSRGKFGFCHYILMYFLKIWQKHGLGKKWTKIWNFIQLYSQKAHAHLVPRNPSAFGHFGWWLVVHLGIWASVGHLVGGWWLKWLGANF